MEYFNTEITKYMPILAIVENYFTAVNETKQAFELLQKATSHLISIHGGSGWNTDIISHGHDRNDLEPCLNRIKKNTWREIVTRSQIRYLLTESKSNELDDMLEHPEKLPEITIDNVQQFISNIAGDLPKLFNEYCSEVFDMLRPRSSEYKTNTEFEIGEKVILNYIVDHDNGYTRLCYRRERRLVSLDNLFHLLDGKGGTKYPGDLVTAVTEAIRERKWGAETEYFETKWHKKGTMHIKFKRMDLVKELNRHAGSNRLKTAA